MFALLHPCVPGLKSLARCGHRQLHEPRKDQATDGRDVSHRQDLTGDEWLPFQYDIEVVHTPQGFVALTEPPRGVLINLDVKSKPRCGVVEINADASSNSNSVHLLIMWITPFSRGVLPVSMGERHQARLDIR